MTSWTTSRRRTSAVTAAAVAAAVAAGVLSPFGGGSAAVAASLPAPPVVGPSDSAPVLKEVVLDWSPVAGAASYLVQVGTDDEWSDDPVLALDTVATRLTLPASLPHASYVWRVAAVGADGQGRWSSAGTFTRGWRTAPAPIAPVGAVDPALGFPSFRWSPVPSASEYQLQVSSSPTFDAAFRTQANRTTESCFTTRTSVTPFNGQTGSAGKNDGAGDCVFTLLGTGAPLWWRVRALDHVVDDAPELATSPVVDEGISSQPPAPMDKLDTSACPASPEPMVSSRPVGGSVPSPAASPSAGPVASASPAASPGAASPGAAPSAAPSSSPAADGQGSCDPAHTVEKGAWSSGTSFSHAGAWPAPVDYRTLGAPARPTASTDVCRDALCRDFPTVSWQPVRAAQWYRLYVALDADFTNIHEIAETAALTWTPTASWRDSTAGAAYHVVVQACTVEDGPGAPAGCDEPSEPLVVRKSSPRLAVQSPAQGAAVGGPEVVLSWQPASAALAAATGAPATSEAYAYRVQVTSAADPDFAAGKLVDEALVDSTHHVAADLRYPDGSYLWRVQAVDASGHRQPWSAVRSFTRDGTAPRASVPSAARFPSTGTLQVRFSEPVTGLGPRSLVLAGAAGTTVPAADRRSATLRLARPLLPGASHVLTLSPSLRDAAGNGLVTASVPLRVDPRVDDRSPALALSGRWKRLAASNAVAGTWSRSVPTVASPTTATVTVHGRAAVVHGCVGPAHGVAEVRVDGVRVSRIDTYRSYSACGVVLARVSFRKAGAHAVLLRGTGSRSARSAGAAVAVDAVTAVP